MSKAESLPRADVAYLLLIAKRGPLVLLRVPAEDHGREVRKYGAEWTAIMKGAKSVLTEHKLPPENLLMLDSVVAPWDWTTQWGGKLLMTDLRERARICDAAFAGEPQWPRHHLYEWTGKAFTRVRAPMVVPKAEEPAP